MFTMKKLCLSVVGSLAIASSASLFAEDVQVQKQSPIALPNFPSAYSEVNIRHYLDEKGAGATPTAQARYTLGYKSFNETLDTRVVFGTIKSKNTSTFQDRGTQLEVEWTALTNGVATLVPYGIMKAPTSGNNSMTELGLFVPVSVKRPVMGGNLSLGAEYTVSGTFGDKVDVQNLTPEKKLSLAATGADKARPTSAIVDSNLDVYAGYEVAAVKGLNFEYRLVNDTLYTPVMEYKGENQVVAKSADTLDGNKYSSVYTRTHRVTIYYKMTDRVYALNEFNYIDRVTNDKQNFRNLISIGTKLF